MSKTFTARLNDLSFREGEYAFLKEQREYVRQREFRKLRAEIVEALGWAKEGPVKTGDNYCASTSDLARWADAESNPAVERDMSDDGEFDGGRHSDAVGRL